MPAPLPPATIGPPVSSATSPSISLTITVGDRKRNYAMVKPASAGPRPTIILLHGANGALMQLGELPQLAAGRNVVTVTPSGLGGRWNFFPPGKESAADRAFFQLYGGLPDDVGFLQALAAELVARGIADPQRIYVVGLSLGGVMALRLACAGTKFAAMALLITGMEETTGAECRPGGPIPVLMMRGTADTIIPDAGGLTARRDQVWPTDRLVDFFRGLNGCAGAPTLSVAAQSSERIEVASSAGCAGGPVVLYRVIGGTHTLPATPNVSALLLNFFSEQTASGSGQSR
jgi:polyhydroxybutyrate depolymerase